MRAAVRNVMPTEAPDTLSFSNTNRAAPSASTSEIAAPAPGGLVTRMSYLGRGLEVGSDSSSCGRIINAPVPLAGEHPHKFLTNTGDLC